MLQDGDVRLRPLRCPDDVPLALGWYADPEVLRFSEGQGTPPYDAQSIEQMYRWMVSAGEAYIVEVFRAGGWLAIGDALLSQEGLPIVIGDARFRSRGIGKRVLCGQGVDDAGREFWIFETNPPNVTGDEGGIPKSRRLGRT